MFEIAGSVVLVTGGQRGLGAAFVSELLARGAAKIYATAREPMPSDDPRVVPVRLDVTDESSIENLAREAGDVTLVINNAGVVGGVRLLASSMEDIRATFETNVFGALSVARAFAPVLAANGGGALVDMHSVLSWMSGTGAYGASKSALWSITNSLREELAGQNTLVIGVHLGYADTDMLANVDVPKIKPSQVSHAVADALQSGQIEVLVDEVTRGIKAILSGPVDQLSLSAQS